MNKNKNKLFVLVGGILLFVLILIASIISSKKGSEWADKQELIDKKKNVEYENKKQKKSDLYNKYKYLNETKIKNKKSSEKFWNDLKDLNFESNGSYYYPSQNYGEGIGWVTGRTEYYYTKKEDEYYVDLHITIYDDGEYIFNVTIR